MTELYHEEQQILSKYVQKAKNKSFSLKDALHLCVSYEELLDQSKVITRISDRLQKKIDQANQKIKKQNHEIRSKNEQLEFTIHQLDKVTMGKKAARVLFVVFIFLFISEQVFLEPKIDEYVEGNYIGIGIMLILALCMKFFESKLEEYFIRQNKEKILRQNKK